MKCSDCRRLEAEMDTWWDKIRLFFFHRFHQDIIDLSQDKFTQGFSDGYKKGYEHAQANQRFTLEILRESQANDEK